ncbi:unnamed protein product [Leuciscus chuanchicus]
MEKCKICNESFSDENTSVVLRAKGSNGVNRASAQRGSSLVTIPGDRVHIECRRSYCKAENIVRDNLFGSDVKFMEVLNDSYPDSSGIAAAASYVPESLQVLLRNMFADNVNHSVATIDGTGTFHGMGIIACITPGIKQNKPVPKIQVTAADIAAVGRINIQYFKIPPIREPIVYQLDVLWKTSLLLHTQRPSWSGIMQMLHLGEHPGRASVTFLPMIDLDPSDESCIYSTLRFVATQALQYDVTPVLTLTNPFSGKP